MTDKRRGLGRGLSALMADLGPGEAAEGTLPLASLRPNPDQPRRTFDEEALEELAESVRARGVVQPLIVRPDPREEGAYQIVAGERRFRAARMAGLTDVPAIVRDYGEQEVAEIALVENVQRADLDAIEEGRAYKALIDRFGHTQEQVAGALGKSRSHIANQMRLLNLPAEVQAHLAAGRLTAGHARPLIGHPDAAFLAGRIVERGLSARDAERMARAAPPLPRANPMRRGRDEHVRAIESLIGQNLGLLVKIDIGRKGSGKLTVTFKDTAELDDLLGALTAPKPKPGGR